jgi:probable HAF family extracellular repeat protein
MKAVSRIVLLLGVTITLTYQTFAQQYSLRAIATLGTHASEASGINNQLEIVGSAISGLDGANHAFLWTRTGGTMDIGSSHPNGFGTGINDSGQVVGCASFPGVSLHAFLWTQANGMQDLGTLGGAVSCARGINSIGQVVGIASTATGGNHAFLWTPETGMQDLGSLGGDSLALGVNDKGQVVGLFEQVPGGPRGAFLWSPVLGMRKLLRPVGARSVEAHAINDLGQIVGQVAYDNAHGGMQRAVLWPHLLKGGVQDLGTLPGGGASGASAISSTGEVAGFSSTGQGEVAMRWTAAGGMQNLNDLVPVSSRWLIFEARGVNGVGKIAANAFDLDTKGTPIRAVLLTPQAAPASAATMH